MADSPRAPLTSIVILAHGEADYSRRTLESVFDRTRTPYELVLVDNGSPDDTLALFEKTQERHQAGELPAALRHVEVVALPENTGYAAGNNRGLERAAGDFICLLNNDVVVTEGWLEELLGVCLADERIGLCGPMTNWTSGLQKLEEVGYDLASLRGLARFAAGRRREHRDETQINWRLTGFCLLLSRALLERIGGLDEIYGLGNFEDDDLCLRAVLSDYRPRVANGAFVHHFGSRTFIGAGIDYQTSMLHNWAVFKRKWSLSADLPFGSGLSIDFLLEGGFDAARHHVPLSVTAPTRKRRAAWLLAGGDHPGAIGILEEVVSQAPPDPDALRLLAEACVQLGDLEGARVFLGQARALRPDDPAITALHAELFGTHEVAAQRPPLTILGIFDGTDAEVDPTPLIVGAQQVPGTEAVGLALREPAPGSVIARLRDAVSEAGSEAVLLIAADAAKPLPGCVPALLDAWSQRALAVQGVQGRIVDGLRMLWEAGGSREGPGGELVGRGAGAPANAPRFACARTGAWSSRFALLCGKADLLAALSVDGGPAESPEVLGSREGLGGFGGGRGDSDPCAVVYAVGRRLAAAGGRFAYVPGAELEVSAGPALEAWLEPVLLEPPPSDPAGGVARVEGAAGAEDAAQLDDALLLSVVIPTRNRPELLAAALTGFCNQDLDPRRFEVVVVDDGSDTPETREVALGFDGPLQIRCFSQAHRGSSAAKNRGVLEARAPIIAFFDDDDVADRSYLSEHLEAHRRFPAMETVVLGHTTWAPQLRRTEAMHHATDVGGFLLSYRGLRLGQRLGFRYFWAGCVSAKRAFVLRSGGFDERFWPEEDIDLGWRLRAVGLEVRYWPRARQYMSRPLDFDALCARGERGGPGLVRLHLRYADPEIRAYAAIEEAEARWAHLRLRFERRKAQVRALEAVLGDRPGSDQPPLRGDARHQTRVELHRLYRWCFAAARERGIVSAKRVLREEHRLPTPPRLPAPPCAPARAASSSSPSLPAAPRGPGAVLVIDEFFPLFDRASGGLRMLRIVERMVHAGRRVVFVARLGASAEVYRQRLAKLGVEAHGPDPCAREAMGTLSSAPLVDLEEIVRRVKPEVCVASFWYVAEHYLPRLRALAPELPVIVDTVDVHYVREAREAELCGTAEARRAAATRRRSELRVYREADRLWVVTARDRDALRREVAQIPIDVVPNVHLSVTPPRRRFADTDGLLFVGNFQHPPNIDAALFLCREIVPRVRARLGPVPVTIAGNRPPEAVQALSGNGVVVTGYVPDLGPLLRTARVSVAPLRYGAGMKGKVGEALSWGLPVVTTSIGAEGMGLEDGVHALIADGAEAFADAVARLFFDPSLWARLATKGPRLVQARWSAARVGRAIERSLGAVARTASRTGAQDWAA